MTHPLRPSTQLHGDGASSGQALVWNGTAWVPGTVAGGANPELPTRAAETAPADTIVWLPTSAQTVTFSATPANRKVVIDGSATWESNAVGEATVWYDSPSAQWRMLYTGGWTTSYLGYATATSPLGPWTRYASNPVFGNGLGGESGQTARSFVFKDTDGSFYTYYAAPYASSPVDLMVATGEPPTMTKYGTALTHTSTADAIQNVCVWRESSTYHMIFESHSTTGAQWQLGHATATSPHGPFTVSTFPLSSLQVGTGSYSGPDIHRNGSTYVLLYHASTSGSLPSDIYRATSTDLVNWTPNTTPIVGRVVDPPEHDQVADPCYVVGDVGGFLFFEGVNNSVTPGTGQIEVTQAITPNAPEWFDGQTWHTFPTSSTTGELLMQDGVTAPPVPIENEARSDWLYQG